MESRIAEELKLTRNSGDIHTQFPEPLQSFKIWGLNIPFMGIIFRYGMDRHFFR